MRTRTHGWLFVGAAVLILAVLPAGAAAAEPAWITGELTKSGYTLIAVAGNGKTSSVPVKHTEFRLRPPTKTVTLQLRAPNGVYAGPVVVDRAKGGKRAIEGVTAGVKLGKVKIKVAKGYARLQKRLPQKLIDSARWAKAESGVPKGAGRFGRVKVKKLNGSSSDPDRDGVPNAFDVDDNGNLVLDNVDASSKTRVLAAGSASEAFFSTLNLSTSIDGTVNANADSTDQQIGAALPLFAWMAFQITGDGAELDCGGTPDAASPSGWSGGLPYCTTGGTGTVFEGAGGPFAGQPFPDCCDLDGDGFGTMVNNVNNPAYGQAFFLRTSANADQIGTGDVMIERVSTGGAEDQLVTTLQYAPATVPALVAYSDGQGNSASVSYPVAGPDPGPAGPGTKQNPFPVKADPTTGEVTVTLTLWRPQRRPIAGEAGYSEPPSAWTDIGGLIYETGIEFMGSLCPQNAYAGDASSLTPAQPETGVPGLVDQAADQPASPANEITFTLNLTRCASSPVITGPTGIEPAPPLSFAPGDTHAFSLGGFSVAPSNGVSAVQTVYFTRVP